jgi:hypothetical protein
VEVHFTADSSKKSRLSLNFSENPQILVKKESMFRTLGQTTLQEASPHVMYGNCLQIDTYAPEHMGTSGK